MIMSWSSDVVPWVDLATWQQYNRLRADALGWASFLVHPQEPASMTVVVEPWIWKTSSWTIVTASVAQTVVMTNPVGNPKLVAIMIDNTWVASKIDWTPWVSPVLPTIPTDQLFVAYVYMRPASTVVNASDLGSNGYIVDRRVAFENPQATDPIADIFLFMWS